jgi:predicted  nucleic acid-binding Zn-ribbon protein
MNENKIEIKLAVIEERTNSIQNTLKDFIEESRKHRSLYDEKYVNKDEFSNLKYKVNSILKIIWTGGSVIIASIAYGMIKVIQIGAK